MTDMVKPKKGKKPKKIGTGGRKHSGPNSANERLKRDMQLARQSTDKANP